jgi:hypothetical protein
MWRQPSLWSNKCGEKKYLVGFYWTRVSHIFWMTHNLNKNLLCVNLSHHGPYLEKWMAKQFKARNVLLFKSCFHLAQWFPTWVPQHTKVPQRGVRGAAKFGIIAFLMMSFFQVGVPPNIFSDLKGSVNKKRLKNTYLSI